PIHCSRVKGKQGPFQWPAPNLASRDPLAQRVLGMQRGQSLNACFPRMSRVSFRPNIKLRETPMPAKIIGMIGTQQEGVAVHLIKGQISREWVIDFTRLHEQWNYDSVLVGYYASAAEGF